MREQLAKIREAAKSAITAAENLEALKQSRVQFLGKKGQLTSVLRGLGNLSPEERPVIGQLANEIREEIEALLAAKQAVLEKAAQQAKLQAERIDVTLPGRTQIIGRQHPS